MQKVICFLFFVFLLFNFSFSQDLFIKSYPPATNQSDNIHIAMFNNGEYVIAGNTMGSTSNQGKLFIRKHNPCGEELWSREINHSVVSLNLIQLNIDSSQNVLLSGQYDLWNASPKVYLIKLSPQGDVLLSSLYQTASDLNTLIYSTSIAPNGDYLVYGLYNQTQSPPNNQQISMWRLAPNGTVKWLQNYDFSSRSWGRMIATKDNGAIAKTSNNLFKVDSMGVIQWAKRYSTFQGSLTPPVETDSGFVFFRVFIGGIDRVSAFLIRHDGSVAWTTNTYFNSTFLPTRGILRSNGNVLFVGSITGSINSSTFVELNPADGSIVNAQQLQQANLYAKDLAENDNGDILFSAVESSGILQQLASGKLNDTLSSVNCFNNELAPPLAPYLLSVEEDLTIPTTLNIDFSQNALVITNTVLPIQSSFSICEYTRAKGDYKLQEDTILCPKQPLLLGNNSSDYDGYLWSTGEQTKTITVNSAGNYWLASISACDTLRDTIEVMYYPVIGLDLGPDTIICSGDSIELGKGLNFSNYLWSDGSTNTTLFAKQSGTYWLEVQTTCGPVRDSIDVQINPTITAPLLMSDTTICFGDSVLLNPGTLLNYEWSTGVTSSTILAKDTGLYWVETKNSCDVLRDSIRISHFPRLNIQYQTSTLESFTGEAISFENLTNNSIATLWDFGDGNTSLLDSTNHIFSEAGTFQVTLFQTSANNCKESISFTIVIKASDYYAPTIFSPNNDGINDFFFPVGKDIVNYEMEIFNRWGASIFKGKKLAWNGKSNSSVRVDEGVYQYQIKITLINQKTDYLKGSVTLIR